MRSFSLAAVTALAAFAVATPLKVDLGVATVNVNNLARDAGTGPKAVERQLAEPGPPVVGNVDWDALFKEMQHQLNGVAGITAEDANVAIKAMMDIMQGKNIPAATLKLFSLPADFLIRIPTLMKPVIIAGTMGMPGANNLIFLIFEMLPSLGRGIDLDSGETGATGGQSGGLGGLFGGTTGRPTVGTTGGTTGGTTVGTTVGTTGGTTGGTTVSTGGSPDLGSLDSLGLPAQVVELIRRILVSLATGTPISPEDAAAFQGLDQSVIDQVLDSLPDTLSNALGTSLLGGSHGTIGGPLL
ncbi:hypothetical protein CcaverHIS002_0212150 [Cutaneotrichosporon cavernicola]|uniref:Uncharacterized protein n=1 Tax=Cutaneotrichosporon cavernicola TaxID=279322 RepID=A0AA48KYX3_9TREE|nr:uncharacterized protein CcaverHIS019_0212160 [Cutaneotrichosporon cavernicola]BEI82055.1 hypothetical protein CcaverHIS002_0212150 [Cutaneotrichosporon cavernicola]BEI89854.1 hypothetical protein CcaverHIS019_0212160 [Cutaneotrichosporon cavernicola]BEI97624.1 hypothetical protein CcaverHIS631_0212130 [Cutaneotrichosporon cavernicola]BEJ05403.1 hypothetical protein CcaverHIS641_0212200 [Cutaneotrichosporon cavernicola]